LKGDVSGLVQGNKIAKKLLEIGKENENLNIEDLPLAFGTVATDLRTGKEIWYQSGSLVHAIRASASIPAVFSPVKEEHSDGRPPDWLVDGALVNPVPVSLCRALGADFVIAVNLNKDVIVNHFAPKLKEESIERMILSSLFSKIPKSFLSTASSLSEYLNIIKIMKSQNTSNQMESIIEKTSHQDHNPPHLFQILAISISILQNRLTTSRLAGDPPDIELCPKLKYMDLFAFDKASQTIED